MAKSTLSILSAKRFVILSRMLCNSSIQSFKNWGIFPPDPTMLVVPNDPSAHFICHRVMQCGYAFAPLNQEGTIYIAN